MASIFRMYFNSYVFPGAWRGVKRQFPEKSDPWYGVKPRFPDLETA